MLHQLIPVKMVQIRQVPGSLTARGVATTGFHYEVLFKREDGSLDLKKINDKWLAKNKMLKLELDRAVKLLEGAQGLEIEFILRCNYNKGNLNINGLRAREGLVESFYNDITSAIDSIQDEGRMVDLWDVLSYALNGKVKNQERV